MADSSDFRRISQDAVQAAIRSLADGELKKQTEAVLRVFLAFKAIHRNGIPPKVDRAVIKPIVEELFTLLPTPQGVPEREYYGTITLRGVDGKPVWLNNNSHRGSFQHYVGPRSRGRFLFEEEDYGKPFVDDAVYLIEKLAKPPFDWPHQDALAAIALRNDELDPALSWDELADRARTRYGLSHEEWEAVTSPIALDVQPFDGPPWDPGQLDPTLRHEGQQAAQGFQQAQDSQQQLHELDELDELEPEDPSEQLEDLPEHLAAEVQRVLDALEEHGQRAIVALAGVPGTSKSHVAKLAARMAASEGCLREIQFSPGYTYEEFMEGPRFEDGMKVEVVPGAFLELNGRALEHPDKRYVLLIEELTRADLPRVLGELLTQVEYRRPGDRLTTMYNREHETRIAPNIAILATFNPSDRSAVNLDAALIRRMRILDFPPSTNLLREMLGAKGVPALVVERLVELFDACRTTAGTEHFEETMPFGHAVFSTVQEEGDLHKLWHQELKRILVRPHAPRPPLYDTIVDHYPWHASPDVSVVSPPASTEPEDQ